LKLGVFIPGRLSSERLPNKLILPIGESSLWEMACKKLEQLPRKYEKYALCYDKELVDIASKYDIKVILRDRETAKAEGPLNYIFKDMNHTNCTHLMFLNPCLSFLSADTIIESLEIFEREEMDYATSVKPLQNWLFDKKADPINDINYERLTTKEISPIYQAAHCFHIFNTKNFFDDGQMLKEGHGLISVPEEETIDVDTYDDYAYAKFRHSKKYVIDIDNTLFITNGTNYEDVLPNKEIIDRVNRLYEAGNTIVLNTARGYETKIDWRPLTEYQLRIFGVKYHTLLFNKPSGDYYIDDKAVNVEEWDI
jgi:CMP-N-acetylneuraminic acid synthetase